MCDRNPSPAQPESPSTAVIRSRQRRYAAVEEEGVGCTGESCQSCAARAVADCVALCCCPCAVVSLLTLAFLKLPLAVARGCIRRRRKEKLRRMMDKERVRRGGAGGIDGISRKDRGNDGNVWEDQSGAGAMDNAEAVFSAEEIWLELYEVGHLAFGRVSFSGNILNG